MTFKQFIEDTKPSDFEETTKFFVTYLIYGVLVGCTLCMAILIYKIISYL